MRQDSRLGPVNVHDNQSGMKGTVAAAGQEIPDWWVRVSTGGSIPCGEQRHNKTQRNNRRSHYLFYRTCQANDKAEETVAQA